MFLRRDSVSSAYFILFYFVFCSRAPTPLPIIPVRSYFEHDGGPVQPTIDCSMSSVFVFLSHIGFGWGFCVDLGAPTSGTHFFPSVVLLFVVADITAQTRHHRHRRHPSPPLLAMCHTMYAPRLHVSARSNIVERAVCCLLVGCLSAFDSASLVDFLIVELRRRPGCPLTC